MTTTELAHHAIANKIESVLVGGDLERLSPDERVIYYNQVCQSLGLNPLTRPFDYLRLNGKLLLYANRNCTDQLRKIHSVSLTIAGRDRGEDTYVVTARAVLPEGRTDESIGAVNIAGLKGDNLANALMKCETKAKRRVTLSICGLSCLDESELDTVPSAQRVSLPAPAMPDEEAAALMVSLEQKYANVGAHGTIAQWNALNDEVRTIWKTIPHDDKALVIQWRDEAKMSLDANPLSGN